MSLLVSNPRLHNIRLPHELEIGRVVKKIGLSHISQFSKIVHLVPELLASLGNGVSMVVPVIDQLLSSLTDVSASVPVDRDVSLKSIVLLEKTLNSGHVVSQVRNIEELLLADPRLLLLDLGEELLVDDGLLQLPAPGPGHPLQLLPDVGQLLEPLLNLRSSQRTAGNQLTSGLLDLLDGGLVAGQLALEPLVLLAEILDSS